MASFPPDHHYEPPDDDHAGRALVEEFHRAGYPAVLMSPTQILLQLPDGTQAQSAIDTFRASTRQVAPEESRRYAERYVTQALPALQRTAQGQAPEAEGELAALRLRVYPESMITPDVRGSVVTRPFAEGLWETVVVDYPDSCQPLPSGNLDQDDPEVYRRLFAAAAANSLNETHEVSSVDHEGIAIVHIGADHLYVASHVHGLDHHLSDRLRPGWGALVCFPVPQALLAHPLGSGHPLIALDFLQEVAAHFTEDAERPLSDAVFWWRPPAETGESLGGAPTLPRVSVRMEDEKAVLTAEQDFIEVVRSVLHEQQE
jgi:hypothetical protein